MQVLEHYGKIESGRLILHNRRRFEADIHDLPDQEVIVTVRKRGRRSNAQNSYYFGVVVQEIKLRLKALGHRLDTEDVHTFLKEKFLPVNLCDEFGTILATIPGSTAGLNKTEFGEYIEKIREWAGQMLEIMIPDPNSKNEMEF